MPAVIQQQQVVRSEYDLTGHVRQQQQEAFGDIKSLIAKFKKERESHKELSVAP